ncbi:MAG TPA: phosphoribosylaminoimidazolesuccinocarboxamide synthase, partial [Alphaproteobacteria bacterium]|nr:phosphoribosylaminoimidazolesuccinocarboxamide synthase [Alphaproteobacteria bacterium]
RTGDAAYCKTLGLDKAPQSGDRFALPIIELSTKLETSDRYLPYHEAQQIAALSDVEFDNLTTLTKLLALRLKDCFDGIGLELWDGKLEFAFGATDTDGNRSFTLVDSIGPDELRLTRDDVHLSKEALRSFYRPLAWYGQLETAKKFAKERGEKDWKKICVEELKALPPHLPQAVKKQAEMIYTGIAKALSQKYGEADAFTDAWDLADVTRSFAALKKDAA